MGFPDATGGRVRDGRRMDTPTDPRLGVGMSVGPILVTSLRHLVDVVRHWPPAGRRSLRLRPALDHALALTG